MSDKFPTLESKASYGVGLNMGTQLLGQPFDGLDVNAVAEGLKDAFNQAETAVSQQEIKVAFDHVTAVLKARQDEQNKDILVEAEAFLKLNAEKEGVIVTESGLQYEIITEGSGEKPTATSKVKTHYHGTLMDGTVFDSSYERGEPVEFPVNGVISGWTEALQMMAPGAKWRLTIPHGLAYGEQGAGEAIGPCATLQFDVELLEIVE